MIKFKNKNNERETEIRYLTYMSDSIPTCNSALKHLKEVIRKIMSPNEKYLDKIVYANIIPRVYSVSGVDTSYYVSLIVKRTYYKDMYTSLYDYKSDLNSTIIII